MRERAGGVLVAGLEPAERRRKMLKLDMKEVAASELHLPDTIERLQVAVFVMCGGGFLGRLAAEQPADFYIDDRVVRLPYLRREIEQAVSVLATLAVKAGLDPHNMPKMGDWHACGIW